MAIGKKYRGKIAGNTSNKRAKKRISKKKLKKSGKNLFSKKCLLFIITSK